MKVNIYVLVTFILLLSGCHSIIDGSTTYDYSIEQKVLCYCGVQSGVWIKLYVASDTVSYAERISDNKQLANNELKFYKSIKGLFNLIAETDTSKYILAYRFDYGNDYPSYVYTDLKPIITDSTIHITEDADISYSTRNYIKLD